MGSFLFKWEHPAKEVYVTGTFDDWGKTVKLDKKGTVHEKLVDLPRADDKVYYKFVVDGNWTTDHTAPQENDGHNNFNNVLLPENITKPHSSSSSAPSAGIMSSVTPTSTTVGLAGNVPKETRREESSNGYSDLPGSFPETPANEASEFSVTPIPATSGMGNPVNLAPGEKVPSSSTPTSKTKSSTAHDDNSLAKSGGGPQQIFGVAPLPATSGIGNPIHLQPGEKVPDPSTFTRNTVNSTARAGGESYDNGFGAPQLPDVVTPAKEREAKGGMFGLPLIGNNMIPESSLPMGQGSSAERDPGMTIQSASPQSTTAALAANVSREPRGVPEIVQESQAEAGVEPEASSNAEAVREKQAMEQELERRVPEEPATVEGGTMPSAVEGVPEIVKKSRAEAGYGPEASSNPEAVREKIAVEEELERKVPEEPATVEGNSDVGGPMQEKGLGRGETAGIAAGGVAAAGGLAGALAHQSNDTSVEQPTGYASHGLPPSVLQSIEEMNKGSAISPSAPDVGREDLNEGTASTPTVPNVGHERTNEGVPIVPIVPEVVQESIAESHQSPEAAANREAVEEKSVMESELLQKVKTEEGLGEPAPSSSAAIVDTAPVATGHAPSSAPSSTGMSSNPLLAPVATGHAPSPTPATGVSSAPLTVSATEDLAAPASAQASTPVTKANEIQAVESRDVSPMSKSPTMTQSRPIVTSGVGQSKAPQSSQGVGSSSATTTPPKTIQKAATPSKPTPGSSKMGDSNASGSTEKKKKRASGFFGKLKEKFSDKDKK
ncbi:MAG: hypothetical protein M1830_007149 [Pleopsidium flavum]|nr:MAG: hypothetical protein M1830_007149 [Pleopsidium flavum]